MHPADMTRKWWMTPWLLRLLHWLGMTNLTDEQVKRYCANPYLYRIREDLLRGIEDGSITTWDDEEPNNV